jgi:predicted DNA-binding protein (MmcQ/YjbR family)
VFAFFGGPDPEAEPVQVSLKCDPELATALVRTHPAITPGYHLNKRHWITVDLTVDLPVGLVEGLLIDSYDLVLDGVPRGRRSFARVPHAEPITSTRSGGRVDEGPSSAGGPARDVRRTRSVGARQA